MTSLRSFHSIFPSRSLRLPTKTKNKTDCPGERISLLRKMSGLGIGRNVILIYLGMAIRAGRNARIPEGGNNV
jgi:hypothetical protein